jgi:hypothetical protein|tara:strand:+ start:946 stop:1227 length:282 start_codon:yes stop_codon:yes gene_type:complete
MEALIRARPILLAVFLCALALTAIGSSLEINFLYLSSGVAAHIALLLFILTESFGTLSKQRHIIVKVMAQLFLVILILAVGNMLFYIVVGFLS